MQTTKRIATTEETCPACLHYQTGSGVCKKFYFNVAQYPETFQTKCQGESFEDDPAKPALVLNAQESRNDIGNPGRNLLSDKYLRFCKQCEHYDFDFRRGILCGLTSSKPTLVETCEMFAPDADKQAHTHSEASNNNRIAPRDFEDMSNDLGKWGRGLILLGFLHLILPRILDPFWGMAILALGIVNLTVLRRGLFIANGAALILVGLMNMSDTVAGSGSGAGWLLFGVMQLVWGVHEIRKYQIYAGVERPNGEPEVVAESAPDEARLPGVDQKHTGLGVASFVLTLAAGLTQVILFSAVALKESLSPEWLSQQTPETAVIELFVFLGVLMAKAGMALGLGGVLQTEKKRRLAFLGLAIGGATLFFDGYLMVF